MKTGKMTLTTGLFISALAFGGGADDVEFFDKITQHFQNTQCGRNQTCNLQEFIVQQQSYKVTTEPGVFTYGTKLLAGYQTANVSDVEKYGIAQFLRGCEFSSQLQGDRIVKEQDVSRNYYGDIIPFRHPNWVIDGVVRDPLDWGFEVSPSFRHFYYKSSPAAVVPGIINESKARYLGREYPTQPVLFVTDHPGVAYFDDSEAKAHNISLEFRTCLYRTEDVPRDVAPDQLTFATPLSCYNWRSSWIYNHRLHRMENPDTIDPFCL